MPASPTPSCARRSTPRCTRAGASTCTGAPLTRSKARASGPDSDLAGEIARHWWQTDEPAAALPWAVRAAALASRAGAHEQAAAHLGRVIEFLDGARGDTSLDLVAILLDHARATYLFGD